MKKKLLPLFLIISLFGYSQNNTENSEIDELRQEIKELKEKVELQNSSNVEEDEKKFTEKVKAVFGNQIKFSGGGLLRFGEWDLNQQRLNSKTGEHYKDDNRFWSRFNFYFNTDVKLAEDLNFNARVRTGNKQYSFVSFGGNSDERLNVILDQFWLDYKLKGTNIRIGRQSASRIWHNQSGAMFDIPTHDGITIIPNFNLGNNFLLQPKMAYFIERYVNNKPLKDQGKIYGFSLELEKKQAAASWKISSGFINADHLPTRYQNDLVQTNDGKPLYNDGDLAPDYTIWANHFKIKFENFHQLSFTIDYYRNFKNYSENPISHTITDIYGLDSFSNQSEFDSSSTNNFTNQRNGFIGTVAIGNQNTVNKLYAGISYLYMEKYAAMDYYAQYDFARWASSNIKGPEFTLAYKLNHHILMKSRLFITEEIKGLNAIDKDYKRSATRLRIDMNIKF